MEPIEIAGRLRSIGNVRINSALDRGWIPTITELEEIWDHYLTGECAEDLRQLVWNLYCTTDVLMSSNHLECMQGLIEGCAQNWMESDDPTVKYVVIYTFDFTDAIEYETVKRLYYSCTPIRRSDNFGEVIRAHAPLDQSNEWIIVSPECYSMLVKLEIATILDAPQTKLEQNRVRAALYNICEKFTISRSAEEEE